jgi:hypothetical protein
VEWHRGTRAQPTSTWACGARPMLPRVLVAAMQDYDAWINQDSWSLSLAPAVSVAIALRVAVRSCNTQQSVDCPRKKKKPAHGLHSITTLRPTRRECPPSLPPHLPPADPLQRWPPPSYSSLPCCAQPVCTARAFFAPPLPPSHARRVSSSPTRSGRTRPAGWCALSDCPSHLHGTSASSSSSSQPTAAVPALRSP